MPSGPIDPARLQGDDLTRWYLRTPAELEQERQAAAAKRYDDFFFGGANGDEDPVRCLVEAAAHRRPATPSSIVRERGLTTVAN